MEKLKKMKYHIKMEKNTINNRLEIYSSGKECSEFKTKNTLLHKNWKYSLLLDFSKGVPVQNYFDRIDMLKQWGCCTNCFDIKVNNVNTSIVYVFKTGRFAPILWIIKISKLYPEITFNLTFSTSDKTRTGFLKIKNNIISDYKGL